MSIVLERLTKRYGSQRVVDDVSLEIGDAELFVLLGASGSGKSTILRLIAGLSRPEAGRILLHGRDVTSLTPQRRGTGFVFQNYSIFRHMTVDQNVEFGLKIRKVARSERARRRTELLELVGLAGLGSRDANQLSGGQQQRVAIARALAYEPDVLLLDEPFGALDVKIRQQLRRHLRAIQRRLGVTTILVTHDQEEAFELADRVGVIDRGRIMEVGPAEELYARPRTLFTSTFLGAGTVVIGRAEGGAARLGPLSLPIPEDIPHEDDTPVQVLFRPEEVMLSVDEPRDGAVVLGRGEVMSQSFAGALRRVRLRLPRLARTRQASPVVSAAENSTIVDAVLPARTPLPEGQPWVSLTSWHILESPAPSLLVCDRGSGSRQPLEVARELAWRLRASITVLGVAVDAEEAEALGPRIKKRQNREGLALAELRVRFGNGADQIALEQAESLHEMIVLTAPPLLFNRRPKRLGATLTALLKRVFVPVLVVDGRRSVMSRILICTISGGPEPRHLRIAGRLAKRLRAAVTLLRLTRPNELDAQANAHALRGDRAALEDVGIECDAHTRPSARPSEDILAEARERDIDLIVVGMPNPDARSAGGRDDVVLEVLAQADRSVLVVPAEVAASEAWARPGGAGGVGRAPVPVPDPGAPVVRRT